MRVPPFAWGLSALLVSSLPVASISLAQGKPLGSLAKRELGPRFKADTGCNEEPQLMHHGAGLVTASGCGITVKYVCGGACVLQERGTSSLQRHREAARDRRREEQLAKLRPRVESGKHEKGYPVLRAILPGAKMEINVTAAPTMDAATVLWVVRFKDVGVSAAACDETGTHAIVANGAPVTLPPVKHVAAQGATEYRLKLPVTEFARLASADRVVGRTCEERWQLDEASLKTLREFLLRFQETLALEGTSAPKQTQSAPPPATGTEKI